MTRTISLGSEKAKSPVRCGPSSSTMAKSSPRVGSPGGARERDDEDLAAPGVADPQTDGTAMTGRDDERDDGEPQVGEDLTVMSDRFAGSVRKARMLAITWPSSSAATGVMSRLSTTTTRSSSSARTTHATTPMTIGSRKLRLKPSVKSDRAARRR